MCVLMYRMSDMMSDPILGYGRCDDENVSRTVCLSKQRTSWSGTHRTEENEVPAHNGHPAARCGMRQDARIYRFDASDASKSLHASEKGASQ